MTNYQSMKLGLLPHSNKPAIRFGAIRTGVVPSHPASADHFSKITDWGIYLNDKFSVCGPTAVGNQRKLETKYQTSCEVSPTQEDVFDLYRRSGNPNFNPDTGADDNGVIMQTMLGALRSGGIGGIKCIAYAKVDVTNWEELQAAEAIFGSLLLGVDLQTIQNSQTNDKLWDYVPSPEWGGHAVLSGRYTQNRMGVITWAQVINTTLEFIQHQLSEAWVVIYPETFSTTQFIEGIDVPSLAKYFKDLTHTTLPIPDPVTPPDDPPTNPGCSPTQLVTAAQAAMKQRSIKKSWKTFIENLPKG
jgi:hypothetical protein